MPEKGQNYFFFGLLLVIGFLAFVIALPYLQAIVLAAALAVAAQPLYKRILRGVKYRSVASLAVIVLVALIIFIPLLFIGLQVVREATGLYSYVSVNGLQAFQESPAVIQLMERFSIDPAAFAQPQDMLKAILDWVLASAGPLFTGTVGLLLNAMLCIFALYYFLKDGHDLHRWILAFSPLPDRYDETIIQRLTNTVNSLVRGYLVIAVIQGLLAGLAFTVFGVPNAALWGSLAAIMSLIPAIGTTFVFVPSILYLVLSGNPLAGIGLWAWWLLTIATVDNMLTPRLVNRGARIHLFAIFIAVLGGITFFGPIGFFIGPLIFSLFFTLLDIYVTFHRGESVAAVAPSAIRKPSRRLRNS